MSKGTKRKAVAAFTLIEMMFTAFIVVVLVIVVLPALTGRRSHRPYLGMNCASNLKQVGLAFRLWAGDNNDKYPQYYVGTTNSPLINNPNAGLGTGVGVAWPAADTACSNMFTIYLAMSNELSNPKIMTCPGDTERTAATNFYGDFALNNVDGKNSKVSYFVGKDAEDAYPQMALAGDRNISGDTTLKSAPFGYSPNAKGVSQGYIKAIGTNAFAGPLNGPNFGWTDKMHQNSGNVALADGSVQQFTTSGLKSALQRTGDTSALQSVLLFP
jgi:prepilin-type processing-associated H-X9-DG protein